MPSSSLFRLMPVALCVATFGSAAQPPASAVRRPDPLDAAAEVPPARHRSAFVRDRHTGESQAIPWREANETAERIGGWRTYAREAQQPAPRPGQGDSKLP